MNSYRIPKTATISPLKDGLFACHHSQANKMTLLSYDGSMKNFDLLTDIRTTRRSFSRINLVGCLPADKEGKTSVLFRYDPTIDNSDNRVISEDDYDRDATTVPAVNWSSDQFLNMIKLGGEKSLGSLRINLHTFFMQKDFPKIPVKSYKVIECSSCNLVHKTDDEPPKVNRYCFHDWQVKKYSQKYPSGFDFVTFWCGKPTDIENLTSHLKKNPPDRVVLLNDNTNSSHNNILLFGGFYGDTPLHFFLKYPRQAAFSPDGSKLAITHEDGLSILCTTTGNTIQLFAGMGFRAVCWSYDGLTIAVANQEEVTIFDMD